MIDYDYNYNILQPYYDYNYNHTGNTMQTGKKKKQSCLGRLGTASVEKTMDTRWFSHPVKRDVPYTNVIYMCVYMDIHMYIGICICV